MTTADRRQAQMDRLRAECDRRADEKGAESQGEPEGFELEPKMNASPASARFSAIEIEIETPDGIERAPFVLDHSSRKVCSTVDGAVEFVSHRAYARPRFGRWTIGMFGSNFVNADPQWYSPYVTVRGEFQGGAVVPIGDYGSWNYTTPDAQPSLFGNIWSAFEPSTFTPNA
jgi:hypothetical protein